MDTYIHTGLRDVNWSKFGDKHLIFKGSFLAPWRICVCAAKSLQSCLTLCNLIYGSPPGSSVPGILQTRTLQWAAISFSSAWKWKGKVKSLSRVRLLTTPWTAAYQARPSMGFSRQEYRSGAPLPSSRCMWDKSQSSLKQRCPSVAIQRYCSEWLYPAS